MPKKSPRYENDPDLFVVDQWDVRYEDDPSLTSIALRGYFFSDAHRKPHIVEVPFLQFRALRDHCRPQYLKNMMFRVDRKIMVIYRLEKV